MIMIVVQTKLTGSIATQATVDQECVKIIVDVNSTSRSHGLMGGL